MLMPAKVSNWQPWRGFKQGHSQPSGERTLGDCRDAACQGYRARHLPYAADGRLSRRPPTRRCPRRTWIFTLKHAEIPQCQRSSLTRRRLTCFGIFAIFQRRVCAARSQCAHFGLPLSRRFSSLSPPDLPVSPWCAIVFAPPGLDLSMLARVTFVPLVLTVLCTAHCAHNNRMRPFVESMSSSSALAHARCGLSQPATAILDPQTALGPMACAGMTIALVCFPLPRALRLVGTFEGPTSLIEVKTYIASKLCEMFSL